MVYFTNILIICKLFRGVIIYTWKKKAFFEIWNSRTPSLLIDCEHIFTRKLKMVVDVFHATKKRHNEG
jgi:hypothetical protein